MKKWVFIVTVFALFLSNFAILRTVATNSSDFRYRIDYGYARITGYSGIGGDIEIPDVLDGYPVISIGVPNTSFGGPIFKGDIKSVIIPEGVEYIGSEAFRGCKSLTSITLPKSLIEIDSDTFIACINLASITIPDNVTTIGSGVFRYCESLTSVIIPESVTKIGYNAFLGCTALEYITINNADTIFAEDYGVNSKGYTAAFPTFSATPSLSEIYAPYGSQAQRYAESRGLKFIPIAKVEFNGQRMAFDVPPIIERDRVLVPFRAIFEEFGAAVDWDDDTETVTAELADTTIVLQIGKPQIQVNGESTPLDGPPQLVNDRTLVPIRAVSEGLGANVEWNDAEQTVIISTQDAAQ